MNPFALPGVPADLLFGVGAILVSGSAVLSVTSLLLRFRRSQGRERRQLYWMVLAAGVLAVVLPVSVALWLVWPPIQVVAALAFPLLPIAACVALLRHHLYDVELVASRTLSWALLTLLLTGSYVALVLTAGLVVSSPVAAALAALLVAESSSRCAADCSRRSTVDSDAAASRCGSRSATSSMPYAGAHARPMTWRRC